MRIDRAIFDIRPLGAGGYVDMAVRFVHQHLRPVATFIAAVGGLHAAIAFVLADRWGWGFWTNLGVFALVSAPVGAALTAAVGARLFGVPLSFRQGFRAVASRPFAMLAYLLAARLVQGAFGMCFVFPALLATSRVGFFPEILLLERCPARQADRRQRQLYAYHSTIHFGRTLVLALLFYVIATTGMVTMELLIQSLTGWSLIAQRAATPEMMRLLLLEDPYVAAAGIFVVWLAYVPCRIAWFFSYLDTRIRSEGWDTELECRLEAQRLRTSTRSPHSLDVRPEEHPTPSAVPRAVGAELR